MSDESSKDAERDYQQEAGALQSIIQVLSTVSPSIRIKIIDSALSFFSIQPSQIGGVGQRHQQGIPTVGPSRLPSFSEDRTITAKEFLYEKLPQTDVERVACLAYYLTHYREIPHFKTSDITNLNTEAAQRRFSNAAVSVDNATKLGYLAQAVKGQKQLSVAGEVYVQALPDREAAKIAMEKVKPRKRLKKLNKSSGAT